MKNKGFTILELLITLIIVGLILSAAYYTYVEIFRSLKEESESVEIQMEKVIGLELLRLDLEHLGYGIAKDSPDLILEWNNTINKLTIRSTLNNTEQATIGWVLCADEIMSADGRKETNNHIVYINAISGNYTTVVTDGSCPPTGTHVGFPISSNANSCTVNGVNTCNTISYRVSTTQSLSHCNPNTRNLLRVVNDGVGTPILHCVAGFKVTFELDTDGDGVIDCTAPSSGCSLPTSNSQLREQLKKINVYAVIQEGGMNKNYRFNSGSITIDGITFTLPSNYQHYRWKVVKISVIPRGMFGGIKIQ